MKWLMRWQNWLRLVILVGGIAFVIVLAMAFRRRAPVQPAPVMSHTDPTSVVESASGHTLRMNRGHQEIRIDYDKLLTYADGSSKLLGVKVVTERDGGRTFTISGKEGVVADKESHVSLTGDVTIADAEGMLVRTERATYAESDGIARAPGMVEFTQGGTTGSGLGMTYDKNLDVLTILDQVTVQMTPEAQEGALQINSGWAEFNRPAKTIHFERLLKATRGGEMVDADRGVAFLSDDEQTLRRLELRGRSRVTPKPSGSGSLQSLQGRDIDVTYAAGGQTIEHTVITGDAVVQLAGERRAGSRISAHSVDAVLAADGVTPTSLMARDEVQLTLPGEAGTPARTITADTMDGRGEAGRGMTSARFNGNVQFRERGEGVERAARSGMLTVRLSPGAGAVEEADFTHAVRFEQGDLKAESAVAQYVIASDLLRLSGSESGAMVPRMENGRIVVDGGAIDVTLTGPKVTATSAVKSVLRPAQSSASGGKGREPKLPAMLKANQPINVTGNRLDYDGATSRAVYTGSTQLWQGDTTIKGSSITIDDATGDLRASAAATRGTLLQEGKDGQARVVSTATAKEFTYEDATRRASYVGDAHLNGPQGDLAAGKIEMYLKEGGQEIDRLEAYDSLTLLEQSRRKTTGARLTYFSADERYLVTGVPVTVLDSCGRQTLGRTLTFYRATDRIVVDGNEQVRTQTKGGSNCP